MYFHVLSTQSIFEKGHKKLIPGIASREGHGRLGMAWEGSLLSPAKPLDALNFCLHHVHALFLWLGFVFSQRKKEKKEAFFLKLACWRDVPCCLLCERLRLKSVRALDSDRMGSNLGCTAL